jgi:hypothetical protein
MRYFTIPEAANFVGVNVKTLRKHVREGRIQSVETPVGIRVTEEALLVYAPLRTSPGNADLDHKEPRNAAADHPAPKPESGANLAGGNETSSSQAVPLAAHLAALEFAARQVDHERERADRAQHRAEQAERSRLALEYQLHQYQAALSEQAESVAEERALRIAAQAAAVTPSKQKTGFWSWLRGKRSSIHRADTG